MMDTVAAVLAAFTPTQAAAHSVKKYDAAIRDHVAALTSLFANQREVISTNASQILQVNHTVSLLILANTPRTLTPRSTLSHFKPSSFSHYKHRTPHTVANEAHSWTRPSDFFSTSTLSRYDMWALNSESFLNTSQQARYLRYAPPLHDMARR